MAPHTGAGIPAASRTRVRGTMDGIRFGGTIIRRLRLAASASCTAIRFEPSSPIHFSYHCCCNLFNPLVKSGTQIGRPKPIHGVSIASGREMPLGRGTFTYGSPGSVSSRLSR